MTATDLDRFVGAQDAVFGQVRSELVHGEKRSHWMWFVFPQITGLGTSPTARLFALGGLAEATRYLAHPVLAARLAESTQLMLGWAGRRSAVAILGPVDALKFCSSMTLFERAAPDGGIEAGRFAHALDVFCHGLRDERTLDILGLRAARPAA